MLKAQGEFPEVGEVRDVCLSALLDSSPANTLLSFPFPSQCLFLCKDMNLHGLIASDCDTSERQCQSVSINQYLHTEMKAGFFFIYLINI